MAAVETDERAVWTTAYINDLPDSCFLHIEPGGSKDSEGKTTPRSLRHFPYKDANGNVDMPHLRNAMSRIPQSNLPQSVKDQCTAKARRIMAQQQGTSSADPPRDNLIRGAFPADMELRDGDGGMPTLTGHFAVFNEWTEINSKFEGRFLERVAPGAFSKTIKESRAHMRVLFQHGRDPQIGDKTLGTIQTLREDERGAYYEVPLHDTSYNRDLLPGLRDGNYGASFRFAVMKEEFVRDAEQSDYNPEGLPERTIIEARVPEFGPVTFPAYWGATAGVRSLTDDFLTGRYAPGHTEDREEEEPTHSDEDPSRDTPPPEDTEDDATATEPTHSTEPAEGSGSRDTPPPGDRQPETTKEKIMASIGEMRDRQKEIQAELEEIATDFAGAILDGSARAKWDELTAEMSDLRDRVKAETERRQYLESLMDDPAIDADDTATEKPTTDRSHKGEGVYVTHRAGRNKAPDNPHDITEYHTRARDQEHLMDLYTEGARKAIADFRYPHERADAAQLSSNVERWLGCDSEDKIVARRVIVCGSTLYRRAFWKTIARKPLTSEEQRAMLRADMELRTEALGLTTGGAVIAVPIQIDPTVLLTSNGVMNPIRQISRNVQTTSYAWQGVTTGGVVAQYQAEAATALNNAGTFNNPTIYVERVTSFVPYSYEIAQDFGGLEAELAREISDAKDTLEATKFALGAGHSSNEPQGILIGAGTVVTTSGGTFGTAMSSDDLFAVEAALPPRHIPRAAWVSSVGVYQRIRKEDTSGGGRFWVDLRDGTPAQLIGYPAYKSSTIGTSVAAGGAPIAGAIWGVFGDWSRYAVVDRAGMFVRNIPDLFGGTAAIHFPTGQSALLGFWRNSAGVLDSGAFRVGTVSKGVN